MTPRDFIFIILSAIILVIALYIIEQGRNKEEAFQDSTMLTFCPNGLKPFFSKRGDTECCDGEVAGNTCSGKPICSFNTNSELPTCKSVLEKEYAKKASSLCPANMTYYEGTNGKGCTTGLLNTTMTAPATTSQPHCVIYDNDEQNNGSSVSCFNQKRLSDVICFGKDCLASIEEIPGKNVALIKISFTDYSGMRHTCYTKDSYIDYINATKPELLKSGKFNPDNNIKIAEVAKAYYIDKTMDKSQIEI
jgi:hypothetical protein